MEHMGSRVVRCEEDVRFQIGIRSFLKISDGWFIPHFGFSYFKNSSSVWAHLEKGILDEMPFSPHAQDLFIFLDFYFVAFDLS